MDCASFRCLIFLSLLVPIATAPAPVTSNEGIHTFDITLDVYSGRKNPKTTIEAQGPTLKSVLIRSLLALDDHQAHAGHDGHAGHAGPVKQTGVELPSTNGYKGIIIKHTPPKGSPHEMKIPVCKHLLLQRDIISLMKMKGKVSPGAITHIRTAIRRCLTATKKTGHIHTDGHKHKH